MRKILIGAAAVSLFFAAHASAATVMVVDGSCTSVASSAGCLFSGNIDTNTNGNSSYLLAQSAYNSYNDTHASALPDITLTPIAESDSGNAVTVTGGGGTSGTWSISGYAVNYVAVKGGDYFDLYQLTAPASSGSWTTANITVGNSNNPGLSHLVLFGTPLGAVPEPGAWVMLLVGFGAAGLALRAARKNIPAARFCRSTI
jgi:hypothetical protein